jgi:hypothetical protein
MSFKDYLTEEVGNAELAKKLFKECRPYIEELRKNKLDHFFYRGTNKKTNDLMKIKPRTDRYPKDMPQGVHEYIDNYFYRKFKWRPRSEGVFTSYRRSEVLNYGFAYIFFPIGKYQYIFSPDIEDLYGELDGNTIMDYIGEDEPSEYLYDNFEYEYRDKYGEESEGGTWHYEGTDTLESNRTEAANVAAEAEGAAIEDEDVYGDIWDKLEWVPDMTIDDFVEEEWQERVTQAEKELDYKLNTYVQSKNLKKAANDNFSDPEVMWLCKEYYIVDRKYEDFLIDNLLTTNVRDFKNTIERIDKQMLLPFKWSRKK